MFGLAIHGGAGTLPRAEMSGELELKYQAGLAAALDAGYALLQGGGTSLAAVTCAVMVLEDNPLFNAGRGSVFTLDGHRLLAGYPTSTPSLTLEDYELTLIGVADLAAYSEQAQVLLGALLPSFYWSLALYTGPTGMPYYDLA